MSTSYNPTQNLKSKKKNFELKRKRQIARSVRRSARGNPRAIPRIVVFAKFYDALPPPSKFPWQPERDVFGSIPGLHKFISISVSIGRRTQDIKSESIKPRTNCTERARVSCSRPRKKVSAYNPIIAPAVCRSR